MDKKLILSEIKSHYNIRSDADFARFLGLKPQTLSSWYSRNVFDIELLYAKCGEIDANWLLTGKGEMLRNNQKIGENHSVNQSIVGGKNNKNFQNMGNSNMDVPDIMSSLLTEKDERIKENYERIQELKEVIQDLKEVIRELKSK